MMLESGSSDDGTNCFSDPSTWSEAPVGSRSWLSCQTTSTNHGYLRIDRWINSIIVKYGDIIRQVSMCIPSMC